MYIYDLRELLIPWINSVPKIFFKRIVLDSRLIVSGDLFIALIGYIVDGRDYIYNAIFNGAVAVISDTLNKCDNGKVYYLNNIPVIFFYHLRRFLSFIAGRFYGFPSKKICLVGVTGTNGKTTVVNLLSQWVNLLGESSAIMGTLGSGILNNLIFARKNITTYSSIENQYFLYEVLKKKVNFVSMEVSSHGLDQYRVDGLYFDAVVFTNLSHDHLDYHLDMERYVMSKWRLFSNVNYNKCIINIDDYFGNVWAKKLSSRCDVVLVSIKGFFVNFFGSKWLKVYKFCYVGEFGTKIFFNSSWGSGVLYSYLVGDFNINNLLLALATLLSLGYPLRDLLIVSSKIKSICGRMEIFKKKGKPMIVIDYAHTPDAFKKLLMSVKRFCGKGKLWCVFGCGGDRDRKKRPLIGKIVDQYADRLVITSDNPRSELFIDIVNDIEEYLFNKNKIKVIFDRYTAVVYAIMHAMLHDVVVIAGKGHEDYQIINNQIFEYSDRVLVSDILGLNLS